MKKKILLALAAALALCMTSGAMGCTAIYVGAGLTADGSAIFGRSEDVFNSCNKLFYVSPAGLHRAGEVYDGCYGFRHTFSHDSYAYTAFSDDNGAAVGNVCPNCGSDHAHSPYESGGTNEMGLTVTATETLYANDAVLSVDPYNRDAGIEEAEIPTILLGECASAREAVELLLDIYETAGCRDAAGVFIGDSSETWYVENMSGSQYIALRLGRDLAFAVPNRSVTGLIDLDDTHNVIASEGVIDVARQAGTYVGDEAANTIHFAASYEDDLEDDGRMAAALEYFGISGPVDVSVYGLSNVDERGGIVPLYSPIRTERSFTIADVVDFFRIGDIGNELNTQSHIFQIWSGDGPANTVEWVAMDHGSYSPFVPCYPMLTTDTYAAYRESTRPMVFTHEQPGGGMYYAAEDHLFYGEEGFYSDDGFITLPENWAGSMYWTFDALSNLAAYGNLSPEQLGSVRDAVDAMQDECYALMGELKEAASMPDAAAQCTRLSAQTAQRIHMQAVELVNALTAA